MYSKVYAIDCRLITNNAMYSAARSELTTKFKRLSRDFTSPLLTSKLDFRGSCKRGPRRREK